MERYIRRDTHVKYQSSSTLSSKVISKVNIFKKWVTGSKIMVPTERSYHREYSCEISKLQKLLERLKFQRGGQNYRMTDRQKTIFDLGGIKIH